MKSKRYSIMNFYIRGSNVTPQVCHALNRLWSGRSKMTVEAQALFAEWDETSETEVILQGGKHKELEDFYTALSAIKNVPSAKFNEGQDDLCGVCTVVTFIASERVVAAGEYLRANRASPATAADILSTALIVINEETFQLTDDEIFLACNTAFLPLVA